jgi:hypothetical protein
MPPRPRRPKGLRTTILCIPIVDRLAPAATSSAASSGVSRLKPPRALDSLLAVSKVNEPSGENGLPSPWLIVIGIVGALALVFLLGAGVGQEWGAEQWGPVASWVASAATFAAVVVALRQANNARRESMRGQLARLVDHEVSRRRECIEALANLWAGITGMQMEFASWTAYLDALPDNFDPRQQHRPAPFGAEQTWGTETDEAMRSFSSKWQHEIEPPLFVALLVLRGTPLKEALRGLNDNTNQIKMQGLEPIRTGLSAGHRPDTAPIKKMWEDVKNRRQEHLTLAQEHFSLAREDVKRAVQG